MHQSSFVLMRDGFIKKWLCPGCGSKLKIIDIGSLDVNGSYRPLFDRPNWHYTGMDIKPGKNVDIVGWENIPVREYDVLISGQVWEHVKRPWDLLKKATTYIKTGGWICIIVPHTCHEHRYPIDTYRYFPDGLRDLFEYAEINIVEVYRNPIPKTIDTIGIGTVK